MDGASCLGTGGLRLAHGLLLDDLALALIVEAWWDLRPGGWPLHRGLGLGGVSSRNLRGLSSG